MIKLKQHNLRPYQQISDAIKECQKVAYVSATGTGKTYVAAKYIEENKLTAKTLIIVPAVSIKETWQKLFPAIRITTYQNLKNIDLEKEKLIILDEMHHIPAPIWNRELMRLFNNYKGKIIGLTATEVRNLDNFLNVATKYFDRTIFGYTIDDAIKNNVLPTFEYICAYYKKFRIINKGKIPDNKKGIYNKLEKRLKIKENEYQIKNILAQNRGDKILAFSSTIKQIPKIQIILNEIFPEYQIFVLHSEQSQKQNDTELENFNKSAKAILITVKMFNEGVHIPEIDTLIMFRKTQSNIVFMQQLGRVLSTDNINKVPQIFDLVGNHKSVRTNQHSISSKISNWNRKIKGTFKEIIVSDYTLEIDELISRLNKITALKPHWTEEELKILKNNANLSNKKLKELLSERTENAIQGLKHRLKLTKYREVKLWTEEELEILKNNANLSINELIKLLPERTEKSINKMAKKKNIIYKKPKSWTEEENQILKNNANLSDNKLKELLPERTKQAIKSQRIKQRILRIIKKPWTKKELKILKNNANLSINELIKLLPERTEKAIQGLKHELKLTKHREVKLWTEEELEILKNNANLSINELIKLLPERTEKAIQGLKHRLKLTKQRNVKP